MARLKALVARAPSSPDLMIAIVLVLTVAMMILPMPILVVDALIGFNLGFAVLLLMVSVYVRSPLEFSSLPGVILISTVFRLALTITTTRLILSQADAGDIIRTFGEFVIGGNVVVGLVVFLIITLVQFIVIAKGAERVAEVGARFTLDALPGKQMAIDAELRNGDIEAAEARRRRGDLESESQFYGAMDGAMKFVKGDAIAGLVVIAVNLIGGITIGALHRGMTAGEAVREYTLLTIGDALISQIPALFLSITAATIVTRVTGENQPDLGRNIAIQLTSDRRALGLAAAVLLGMGLIPGFPTPVFVLLALVFGAASLKRRRSPAVESSSAPGAARGDVTAKRAAERPTQAAPLAEVPAVALVLAPAVLDALVPGDLERQVDRIRAAVAADLGILVPPVAIGPDPDLAGQRYRIDVEGVPVEEGEAMLDRLLLRDDPAHLTLLDIPVLEEDEAGCVFVEAAHRDLLVASGVGFQDGGQVLASRIRAVLVRYASRFVGIQETRALLARLDGSFGDLVKETLRTTPVLSIADVLRRLLDEGIPVRNTRLVLEALAQWGEKEQNVVLLTEYVRAALKRQICFRYANPHRVVAAYLLEREAEDVVRAAVRETAVGPYLVLDESSAEALLLQVRHVLTHAVSERAPPVILASMDIRRFVRGFLIRNGLDMAVLSYQDLASDFTVQPVGSIRLKAVATDHAAWIDPDARPERNAVPAE
jgi:type III secretion protein V